VRALKQWLPVVLWAGLILWAANDDFSANNTGGWLRALFGEVPHVVNVALRKTTHVVVYAILGLLVWRADRRVFVILGVTLLVASTDEWLQSHARNRTGTPWDVALDLGGASLAILLQRARHLRHQGPRTDAH